MEFSHYRLNFSLSALISNLQITSLHSSPYSRVVHSLTFAADHTSLGIIASPIFPSSTAFYIPQNVFVLDIPQLGRQ